MRQRQIIGANANRGRRIDRGIGLAATPARLAVLTAGAVSVVVFFDSRAQLSGRRHRLDCTGDNLGRPRARLVVGRTRFEDLGIRQDDAELVVQPVEESAQIS
jgi:hypothetical protein